MARARTRVSLIIHGGASDLPEADRPEQSAGLDRALARAWELLESGGSALDAVEAAVQALEDDPAFDAGVGSVLRLDGSVSLDASIMDGFTRRSGAVAGVTRARHPVSLARHILEKTPHAFVIAAGADELARQAGLELCDPSFFITPREVARLQRILGERGDPAGPQGTVGAVARDVHGHIAAATSTGGVPGAIPGRVGDTPIIGAGTFADDRWGGASSTGRGENMIRTTLARELVRVLGDGLDPAEAAPWAVRFLQEETGGTCGMICIGPNGTTAAAHTTPWMAWARREAEL